MYTLHILLSLLWTLVTVLVVSLFPQSIQSLGSFSLLRAGFLPGGPFGLLAAFTHQFYRNIPPLWTIRISDAEISDRTLVGVMASLVRDKSYTVGTVSTTFLVGRCGPRLAGLGPVQCTCWRLHFQRIRDS